MFIDNFNLFFQICFKQNLPFPRKIPDCYLILDLKAQSLLYFMKLFYQIQPGVLYINLQKVD